MHRARSATGSIALLCLFAGALALPASVNARTPGVKTLTDVGFTAAADHIEFTLRADTALDPAAISARKDGAVLMIRIDDARADRRWLTTQDPLIKRTLLHPSRKHAPAAIVRTRLTRKVSPAMLENIRVRVEDGAVVVAVPRSAAIARRWAAAPAAEAPVEPASAFVLTFAEPAAAAETDAVPPAIAAPEAPAEETEPVDAAPAAIAAAPIDAAPLDPADTPLTFEDEAPLAGGDVPLNAGLTQVAGPGLGAFLMSLLFLGAVGFFMWRKMRGGRPTAEGGPVIRPVGSHMLGPKQSLLLVDVAGEMVLLGTSDKGVQMLTKIEGKDEPSPVAGAVTPAPQAVPVASFAERLGAAVSRFRTAAARLDGGEAEAPPEAAEPPAGRRFFNREKVDVRDDAAEEAALAALADRVEDEAPESDARRRARTHFAPVEPAPARAASAPPLDPTADLLRKIRSLQRA